MKKLATNLKDNKIAWFFGIYVASLVIYAAVTGIRHLIIHILR